MKKKSRFGIILLTALLIPVGGGLNSSEISAASTVTETVLVQSEEKTQTEASPVVSGWVERDGKRYYVKSNGKLYKGFLKLNGKRYYLSPELTTSPKKIKGKLYYFDKTTGELRTGWQTYKQKKRFFLRSGYMASSQWIHINGKYYYIKKDGTRAPAGKWLTVKDKRYYISKKGYRLTGFKTIKGKQYYFQKDGSLLTNQSSYEIRGAYYSIGADGIAVKVSALQAECERKARQFVEKHTTSGMSNSQKFRACFNYLMAYTDFKPWIYPTDAEFKTQIWPYQSAIYMFDNGLSGSCYGIASAIAACAKVLGYDPYVVATTGDHGFVIIDGLYYDNMGPLFGASTHFAYTTRSIVKF